MSSTEIVGLLGLIFSILFGLPPFGVLIANIFKSFKRKLKIKITGFEVDFLEAEIYLSITNNKNYLISFQDVYVNKKQSLYVDSNGKIETFIGFDIDAHKTKPVRMRVLGLTENEKIKIKIETSDGSFTKSFSSFKKMHEQKVKQDKKKETKKEKKGKK